MVGIALSREIFVGLFICNNNEKMNMAVESRGIIMGRVCICKYLHCLVNIMENYVKKRVAAYFHINDYNCVRTDLLILAEYFRVRLDRQILNAAVGMHGAGGYRAQCGLVEGTLMFLGLIGAEKAVAEEDIVVACRDFGQAFEEEFSSLQCRALRPGGFKEDDPPHLCEDLACRSTIFSISFVEKRLKLWVESS